MILFKMHEIYSYNPNKSFFFQEEFWNSLPEKRNPKIISADVKLKKLRIFVIKMRISYFPVENILQMQTYTLGSFGICFRFKPLSHPD